jgi:hypothetical protein
MSEQRHFTPSKYKYVTGWVCVAIKEHPHDPNVYLNEREQIKSGFRRGPRHVKAAQTKLIGFAVMRSTREECQRICDKHTDPDLGPAYEPLKVYRDPDLNRWLVSNYQD